MSWIDTPEEREDYGWTVKNLIPYTAGMWGQPMFSLKYTPCEDMTRDDCGCMLYDERHPKDEQVTFSNGGVWSEILALPWEKMWDDHEVDENM